jgi:hypothetical protein
VDSHYRFSDGHLSGVKGYEYYTELGQGLSKISKATATRPGSQSVETAKNRPSGSTDNLHVWGTPEQALEKLRFIHELTGASDFLGQFTVGGISFDNAKRSMTLFAEKVAPVVRNDPAFAARIPELPANA